MNPQITYVVIVVMLLLATLFTWKILIPLLRNSIMMERLIDLLKSGDFSDDELFAKLILCLPFNLHVFRPTYYVFRLYRIDYFSQRSDRQIVVTDLYDDKELLRMRMVPKVRDWYISWQPECGNATNPNIRSVIIEHARDLQKQHPRAAALK